MNARSAEVTHEACRNWSHSRVIASTILAAVAWYAMDYVANILQKLLVFRELGVSGVLERIDYGSMWIDPGWGSGRSPLPFLLVPAGVLAVLAVFRRDFTWRRALIIGICIVAAQTFVLTILRFHNHAPLFDGFGLAVRLGVVFSCVFAAAAAWWINLGEEPVAA